MDQRRLLSTSASDTSSKPNSDNPETKFSEKNEKSEGSESSDGGSDQKNDRASGKDIRGAVSFSSPLPFLIDISMNKSLRSSLGYDV